VQRQLASEEADMSNVINVLLVDDEVGFVEVLSKRLSKRDMVVTAAYSGTEAIQILRKQDFDVAVLDLKLEDMDGIEILRIFKKLVPTMPVIMLTGHGSEQAAQEGLACGAFDYLTKPSDLEDLIAIINQAVNREK
jgi:DNA-binding response OmpR family regulator